MIKVIINFFCVWHCIEYSLCMCRDKAWIYVIQRLPSDKCYQVKRLIHQSRERFIEWVNWDSGQYNDYGTQYSNGWKSSIHSHLSSSMSMQMLASSPAWCLMAIGWLNWWLYFQGVMAAESGNNSTVLLYEMSIHCDCFDYNQTWLLAKHSKLGNVDPHTHKPTEYHKGSTV